MQTFDEAYTRLNPEQKRAVETTEGPVLVIAGPGTGKTQVLTLRIAHILQKTDTLPENILALTFTDNAAQNMRERLIEFIGVTAYRIKITTFHSFANDIIQSFPEKFAFRKELEQIDDLQKFTIFSELLTSYDPSSTYKQFPEGESIAKELYGNNPQALKPFNAPELYTNEILQKIDRLKREFVSKEKFASLIRDELDTFKTQEKINPRTKKPYGAWTSQAKVIVKNIELLHFYTEYKKKMDERGLYDFGDMIANVAESLQNDDEVLAHFQERFLYILLDEFQDTNGAQNAIVTALGSWDSKPNIFAVGDDDQSIFRFQGANLANILEFTNQYPDAQIITLKTNYRSYQEILDAADTVIQNNSERLGDQIESVSKKLTAFQENGGSISLGNFSKQELEYHYIAEKISTLLKEGIDPNEIAVIYHKHKDGEEIRAVFEKHTIPLEIVVSENIVEQKIFKDITLLLKVIHDPNNDRALAELLLIDEFNLPPVEIYKILNHLKRKRDDTHLCELLLDLNTLNTTLSLTSSQQFYAFAERILRMQKAHANMSFGHFFELVLNQSGLLDNARNNKEYHVLATIKSLFDFLHERAQRIKDYNLTTFFEDLEIIHDHNIKLKIHDFNPASSQGVNMLTAFASKGLEFEYVFMPKLIDKTWGNVRNIEKLKLLALTNQITEDEKELRNEEERRLFFVGLTRAKKELILTYAEEYKDNLSYRKALPSQFITELNEKNYSKIPTQDIENNHDEILRLQTEYVEPMVFSHSEEEYLQNLLKSFKLSASALNTYLEDPQKFLYRYLIKLPEVKSKHLALGSAIHSSLEYFYRSLQTEEKKDLPYLKKVFSVALEKEFAGYPDFEATQEEGIKLLTNWYNEQENFKIPIALEYSFYGHNVYLEDIPLVGLIDKIEWIDKDSKTVKIIDYKTGSPKTSGQILKPIDGGIESNIYRQVVFYTLLSQLDRNFPYEVEQSEIQFIKLDNNKLRTVPIDVPLYDIEMLRSIIIATMTQIRNLEF